MKRCLNINESGEAQECISNERKTRKKKKHNSEHVHRIKTDNIIISISTQGIKI